mgnify:CR=1 FL=1
MNKELKRELKKLKSESDLRNRVIKIALDNIDRYEDGTKYFEDILSYGCQSGLVSELIYYYQTEKFFDQYADEIFELYNELVSECGQIDMELNKNNLSWLAFEETLRSLYYDLGYEY